MKKIILLILLFVGISFSYADCAMNGMEFFPKQKEISLSPMFIIQGYSMSQKTVENFKNRKVYVESENGDLTELILVEILKSEKYLTQAIFKVSKELLPNLIYYIKYSDENENEKREMLQYNKDKNKHEKVFWKTSDLKSIDLLNSNLKIIFEKTDTIFYGCGPEANAIFKIVNKVNSEIWYKTELIEIETNKKTIFYITENNNKLKVGHGMCSGAFIFKQKGKYKVRFTPMNIDGQELTKTEWKTFESPFALNKNKLGF
jgi:hypothetical protein